MKRLERTSPCSYCGRLTDLMYTISDSTLPTGSRDHYVCAHCFSNEITKALIGDRKDEDLILDGLGEKLFHVDLSVAEICIRRMRSYQVVPDAFRSSQELAVVIDHKYSSTYNIYAIHNFPAKIEPVSFQHALEVALLQEFPNSQLPADETKFKNFGEKPNVAGETNG